MRFTDLMMAFPALLLAIALAAIFSPSLWIVALVIAMVNWVQVARVVYTQTRAPGGEGLHRGLRARSAPSPLRILARHVLPHLLPTMLVWGTLGIATTVLLEATLSFLGVGVRPPTPSWGNIIFENQTYFATAPWLVFFPGAAILLLALSFNLVGDALHDALDPTQRGRGVGMLLYIAKRLGQAVFILIGITLVTYVLLYLVPADPVRQIAGRSATAETVESIRRQLGLDLPLWQQYLRYLGNLAAGRPRPLLHPEDRGQRADPLAPAGDLAAARGRDRGRAADRAFGRHLRRHPARPHQRPRGHGALVRRRLGAAVRGRHPAALRLFGPARLVPDRRLRHLRAPRAAGGDARHPGRRLVLAHDALEHDRGAAARTTSRPRAPRGRASAASCSCMPCATPRCR